MPNTTNAEKLTAETITDEQIEALMAEAQNAGDFAQVAVCRVALGWPSTTTQSRDAWSAGVNPAMSDDARAACAEAINAARAMEDE